MSDPQIKIVATSEELHLAKKFIQWRVSPVRFVKEVIGVEPSNQQTDALQVIGWMVNGRRKRSKGEALTAEETKVIDKIGITIRSGKGPGKDAWLSWVCWWFLMLWRVDNDPPKLVVTGPSAKQIRDVFWSEMSLWKSKSAIPGLFRFFEQQAEIIYGKEDKRNWFLSARVCNVKGDATEQAGALGGLHAPYMLLAGDESSDLPYGVFTALEGTLTGVCNILILVGNMLRTSGYFYDSHFNPKSSPYWVKRQWNTELSNLDDVSKGKTNLKGSIERLAAKYGSDSNFYRINVLGEPPSTDLDSLIPYEWVRDASMRDIEADQYDRLVIGVDVARSGDDKSIMLFRRGPVVEEIQEYRKIDTMELTGWIMSEIQERPDVHSVYVDIIGIGAGVYDRLNEMRPTSGGNPVLIFGVNVAEQAAQSDIFPRLRDELWWRVREKFEKRIIKIPEDDELIGELSTIRWAPVSEGRRKVEGKPDMKRRGLQSPNKADALCLSYYHDDHFFKQPKPLDKYSRKREAPMEGERSWMVS